MKYWILISILLIGLNAFTQDSNQVSCVLEQLNLSESKFKMNLIVSKIKPNNPEETILVIPEIVEESEHYFELNSHIVVIDNKTSIIKRKYFESSKTNEWFSDAIELVKISIDTAPYTITNQDRAFGIKVRYVGSSQVNPYESVKISLFIEENDILKPVLKNQIVKQYNGRWDGDCVGEFTEQNKILIIQKNGTNEYADILVRTTISNSVAFIDVNDQCDEKEIISKKSQVLKYTDGLYK